MLTVQKEEADPLTNIQLPTTRHPSFLSFFFFKLHSNSKKSNVCFNLDLYEGCSPSPVLILKQSCPPNEMVTSTSKSKRGSPPPQWHRGEIFSQRVMKNEFKGKWVKSLHICCNAVRVPSFSRPPAWFFFLFVCFTFLTVDFCEGGEFSFSFLCNNKSNHWNWEIDLLSRINRWGYWLFSDLVLLLKMYFFQGVVVLFSFSIAFELPPTEVKKETTAIQACWLSYKRTSFKLVYTTDSKWIQDGG